MTDSLRNYPAVLSQQHRRDYVETPEHGFGGRGLPRRRGANTTRRVRYNQGGLVQWENGES